MAETFGEQRYSLRGIYMINTIKRMKLAVGYQGRVFVFGRDMNGWNMENENAKHITVTNTVYMNNAIFAEGMYNLIDKKLDIGFAARYDAHTRTIAQGGVFNPKLALIWKPSQDHVIKVIYQTSANNGSADNYEFNRNSVNDNGEPLSGTSYRYEKPFERPNSGNNNILAPVSQSDLYKLKPERSSSVELASVHQFGKSLLIQPSISYNSISDLFIWNQAQFRVLNGGNYNFFNFELEAKYNTEKIKFGINHALQKVVNTDINQTVSYTTPIFSGYDSTLVNGVMTYSPKVRNVPGKNTDTTYYLNTISGSITKDGSNFLSLASNVTKVYFDYSITKWL
ncbi:MAG: hypothetical protein K2Q22_16015, partial [Cytophagales bacterium]|nr:hypothetical protein [Cytophagales bacterium]